MTRKTRLFGGFHINLLHDVSIDIDSLNSYHAFIDRSRLLPLHPIPLNNFSHYVEYVMALHYLHAFYSFSSFNVSLHDNVDIDQ